MVDQVARILEQWRREEPDLAASPVGIFGRIERIEKRRDAAVAPIYREHGLDGGDYDVLAALRRAGEPYVLTPTQLYRSLLVTSGTMTVRLDRLERRGLVLRRPSPTDRRSVTVGLTPAGREIQRVVIRQLLEAESALLDGMTPASRARLARSLEALSRAVDEEDG